MAYDDHLAARLREIFARRADVEEKKMFGGLAFMVSGYMCCGVNGSMLMVRVGPAHHEHALADPHVRNMDFTGKPLKGYVYVLPAGLETDESLQEWVHRCEQYVATLPPRT